MFPSWRVIFKVLTTQENSHAKEKEDILCHPSAAEPQTPLQSEETVTLSSQLTAPPLATKRERDPSQSVEAFAAGYCQDGSEDDGEDPFDPRPVNSEKEPDLYPSDPHGNFVRLKQQALKEGKLDIAERIVAPVIYQGKGQRQAKWEPLSFLVVKQLRWTVTEHGIGYL